MSRLDAFFGRIRAAGVDLALGFGINYSTGLNAQRNPTTKYVDVTLAEDAIQPANVAPASGMGIPVVLRVAFASEIAGAVDTEILASADFDFRILDVTAYVTGNYPGATWQLRTAAGGLGSVLSSALATDNAGVVRNNDSQSRTVVTGGAIYLRRSVAIPSGEIIILAVRT